MRSYLVLVVALMLWTVFSVPRVWAPFKRGHDAYISSQIGSYAHHHVRLGLGVTRGANLTAISYSGEPRFYFSYTPLASWLLALVMQLGVPFFVAVRLFMLVLSLLFFASLWMFTRNLWGRRVADYALLTAILLPVTLRYGLACIWEVMALAPLLLALVMFTSSRPRDARWLAWTALAGTAAVMFSWIAWLVLIPCAVREMLRGHLKVGAALCSGVLLLPLAVQFATLGVTGVSFGAFLARGAYRLGPPQMDEIAPVMSHAELAAKAVERLVLAGFGPIPFALMTAVVVTAIAAEALRRPEFIPRHRWLLLLLAYAIPLNVLDVAKFHDFFIILLVPLAAIATGIVCKWVFERVADRRVEAVLQPTCTLLVVVALLVTGVWPARALFLPAEDDYAIRELTQEVAARAESDVIMVISHSLAAGLPGSRPPATIEHRDVPLKHTFTPLTEKSGVLAYDHKDTAIILDHLVGRGERIIIFAKGDELSPLPPMSDTREILDFTIGEYQPR